MYNRVVLLAVFCLVGPALTLEITDCLNRGGSVFVDAQVSGCPNEDIENGCVFRANKPIIFTIKFKTVQVIHTPTYRISIFPYYFDQEQTGFSSTISGDACDNKGLTCPLAAGEHKFTYELNENVMSSEHMPMLQSLRFEFAIRSDDDRIMCAAFYPIVNHLENGPVANTKPVLAPPRSTKLSPKYIIGNSP